MAIENLYDSLFVKSGRHILYDYQRRLLASQDPFIIINKSRQIGISSFYACHALVRALVFNETVLIVSPSERQSKHVMDYVQEYLRAWRDLGLPKSEVKEETKHGVIFTSGGAVHSLPNSASTIRGFRAHLIILDEFAHFLDGTDKDVFEAIAPSMVRGGHLIVISTPFGEMNMFFDFWNDPNPNIKKHMLAYTACPDLIIERKGSSYFVGGVKYDDTSFRQEFANEFIGEMTSEFPLSLIMPCVNPELELLDMHELRGRDLVGGYDVARDQDLSVVHVYEVTLGTDKRTYILRGRFVWRGLKYQAQYERLMELLAAGKWLWFNMDATANKDLHERIFERYAFVKGIHFTNELKHKMVHALKTLYEEKRLQIPDEASLIRAVNSIQRKYSETNYLKFDSTRQEEIGHADEFWAQALATYEGYEFDTGAGVLVLGGSRMKSRQKSKALLNDYIRMTGG